MLGNAFRSAIGNCASLVYLGTVAAFAVFAWWDTTFAEHPDASFAWLAPMLLTAPGSLLLMTLPWLGAYPPLLLGALFNSLVIGSTARILARRA